MTYTNNVFLFLVAFLCSSCPFPHADGHSTHNFTDNIEPAFKKAPAPIMHSLAAVVTGMEHSGTTAFSYLVKSHSNISGGFECGIFLGQLAHFERQQPFSDWMKMGAFRFGLPSTYLPDIANMTYAQVVQYINTHKGTQDDEYHQLAIRSGSMYLDKTPRYIYHLTEILEKIHTIGYAVPVFVILKSFDDVMESWMVKRNETYELFMMYTKQVEDTLKDIAKARRHQRSQQKSFNFKKVFVLWNDDMVNDEEGVGRWVMRILRRFHPTLPYESLSVARYNCETERLCGTNEHVIPSIWGSTNRTLNDTLQSLDVNEIRSIKQLRKSYDMLLQSLSVKFSD